MEYSKPSNPGMAQQIERDKKQMSLSKYANQISTTKKVSQTTSPLTQFTLVSDLVAYSTQEKLERLHERYQKSRVSRAQSTVQDSQRY